MGTCQHRRRSVAYLHAVPADKPDSKLAAADFYIHLLDAVIEGKSPASGAEGLFFLENGEYTQHEAATVIAQVLFENRHASNPKPVQLTEEEFQSEQMQKYYLVGHSIQSEKTTLTMNIPGYSYQHQR